MVALLDGHAQVMGEGIFIVVQTDEYGETNSVVLTAPDLAKMLGVQIVPALANMRGGCSSAA